MKKLLFIYNIPDYTISIRSDLGISGSPVLLLYNVSILRFSEAINSLFREYELCQQTQNVAECISFEIANKECLDEDSALLIEEIHNHIVALQNKGVSLRTIREVLLTLQHISPIQVTSDYRIFLPDFGNLEISMNPLPKALYILYLRHPEGIAFKSLIDYHDELYEIYSALQPKGNPNRLRNHVDNLCNPLSNSIYEKASQIAYAFSQHLDESLLAYYILYGESGGIRKIRACSQS